MFELTLDRLSGDPFGEPLIVCNVAHRQLVADTCKNAGVTPSHVILEPVGRNTAPAVALAALCVAEDAPDAILLVATSDHVIRDTDAFTSAVKRASAAAERGKIVAFGIRPDRPETGYGYIRRGDAIDGIEDVFVLDRFVEKPDSETAKAYFESGDFAWNSGMFMFRTSVFLDELSRQRPDILDGCKAALGVRSGNAVEIDEATFAAIEGDSIDYAVMEGCNCGAVAEADFDWNDIGSWQALWEISEKDDDGNARTGKTIVLDSKGCLVRADNERRISIVGCEDLIVVVSGDHTLVMPRSRSQEVKRLLEEAD